MQYENDIKFHGSACIMDCARHLTIKYPHTNIQRRMFIYECTLQCHLKIVQKRLQSFFCFFVANAMHSEI